MASKKKAPPLVPAVDEDTGVLDDLHAWYLGMAARDGVVYTWVLRQLVNKLYRDRDYLEKRQLHERRTSYDWALERDQMALAWAIQQIVLYVPDAVKALPEPPKPPRKPSQRLAPNALPTAKNGGILRRPRPDWIGPELPPTKEQS